MKIIVPMAGRGTRLRPHTLTVPKPLIPIAGKPIVQRLIEDLAAVCNTAINEVAFVIDRSFGKTVEESLIAIASKLNAKGTICYQDEKLGTAHAILMAEEALKGNVLVAFADILFKADFNLDLDKDGIIWVQKVEDPSAYGVVKINEKNQITDFIEKPETYVSDLAIIGIYYFKDGENLRAELQYLIENDIRIKGGEFGLTDALENMKNKGLGLEPGEVAEWLDCGNKESVVNTNQRYLTYLEGQKLVADSAQIKNSVIIEPVFIGENVILNNSVVGPYVSIGNNTEIHGSVVSNSIIQEKSKIKHSNIKKSMIGNQVNYLSKAEILSLGDFNSIEK